MSYTPVLNNPNPVTHFIEVWEVIKGNPIIDRIAVMYNMENHLFGTKFTGGKTIAIFKIRPKN